MNLVLMRGMCQSHPNQITGGFWGRWLLSGGIYLSSSTLKLEFQASFYSLRGIRDPWRALASHEKIISLSHCPVSEHAGGNFPWNTYQVHCLCTGLEIFHLSNYFAVACGKGRTDFFVTG